MPGNAPFSGRAQARIWATLDPFVEGGAVLGRRVANASFLEAFLRADPYDAYHFFLSDREREQSLRGWLQECQPGLLRRDAVFIGSYLELQGHLADTRYHCMHLSDVLGRYTRLARLRNAFARAIFPVTGLTHSLSYSGFMQEYHKHLWAGVSSRDAIMVTSESARLVMQQIFAGLREGYALTEHDFPAPRLERMPLGVVAEDLPKASDRWEEGENTPGFSMRRQLGLSDELIFLCFGRISPASKMDLMPLFAALRRAVALGLPPGHALVLAGWVDEGDTLPEALCAYGNSLGIRTLFLPRPTREQRLGLYAAADVFLSPSDNIQETFGLTVAEAGGAGLPVIASDFDGYRDIVAHGESGLLIPTLGFARSWESDLQALCWYDNQYHLKLAQETVVDVPAMAGALARLGSDAALRKDMGEAGRARVKANFIWDAVIERYVQFWDALAAAPLAAGEERRLRSSAHPQQMHFARYFQGHFSEVLDEETAGSMLLRRTCSGEALYRGALPVHHYAGMEHMLDAEAVRRLLLAARHTAPAEALLRNLADYFRQKEPGSALDFSRERAEFTLLWCLKQDYLERIPEQRG